MYFSSSKYNYTFSEEDKEKDKGKVGVVQRSDRDNKKFKVLTPDGKTVHFGHSDYTISGNNNQSKGDSYCARSNGIKDSGKYSPNNLSRIMWSCKGDKAVGPPKGVGDKIF